MKTQRFKMLSDTDLLQTFLTLAMSKAKAVMETDTGKLKRLYPKMQALNEELRSREGDKRRLLMKFYNHPNPQVRVEAATATLAIAPDAARESLQLVCDRHEHPYALEAGMRLDALERGIYRPT